MRKKVRARIVGLSAYEEAVKNGFDGTEAEWLASLKGEKGETGDSPSLEVTNDIGGYNVTATNPDGTSSNVFVQNGIQYSSMTDTFTVREYTDFESGKLDDLTGEVVSNSEGQHFAVSDFIDISNVKYIYRSAADNSFTLYRYAFYNNEKEKISLVANNTSPTSETKDNIYTGVFYVLNESAKYIRIMIDTQRIALKYNIVNIIHNYNLDGNIESDNIRELEDNVNNLQANAEKTDLMFSDKYYEMNELVCKKGDSSINTNKYCAYDTGLISNSNEYSLSDYIPIKSGERYQASYAHSYVFFDEQKNYITGFTAARLVSTPYWWYQESVNTEWKTKRNLVISTIEIGNTDIVNNFVHGDSDQTQPVDFSNAAYMRVNFSNGNFPDSRLNRFAICRVTDKPYDVVCFGDSIFGNNEKPFDICSLAQYACGLKFANCGLGGTSAVSRNNENYNNLGLKKIADAITSTASDKFSAMETAASNLENALLVWNVRTLNSIDFDKVKYITLAYGTNDWNAVGSTLTAYKEALGYAIEKISTKYPHIQICLLAPIYRNKLGINENQDSDTYINPETNLKLTDFVEAMREVAEKYKLPFFDHYHNSGINALNADTFLREDGTHLTLIEGASRIGEILAGEITSGSSDVGSGYLTLSTLPIYNGGVENG